MKAWVTVDLSEVIEIVNRFGRLKVLDDPELFIEVKKVEDFRNLQKALRETRGRGGSRKNCQKVVVQCTECHPRETSFEKPHNIDKL